MESFENCANCRYRLKPVKMDYSKGGCEHSDMEGYICLAFQSDGIGAWMVGCRDDSEICECYLPKEGRIGDV